MSHLIDEKGYLLLMLVRFNYDNEDYFCITCAASDELKIDYKLGDNEVKVKPLDPRLWNIEDRKRNIMLKSL
jgi:hypothetical protein